MTSLKRCTRSASRCSSARSFATAAVPSRISSSSFRDGGAALVARLLERRDLARLRRFERRELRFDARRLRVELRELRELAGDGVDARRARAVVVIEVDEHPAERGRALLRQQQLEQLLAPGHVARAHLARQRRLLRREPAVRCARSLASDRAAPPAASRRLLRTSASLRVAAAISTSAARSARVPSSRRVVSRAIRSCSSLISLRTADSAASLSRRSCASPSDQPSTSGRESSAAEPRRAGAVPMARLSAYGAAV